MGRIATFTHVTLDGVMQAPGRPDEDTRGEFGYGGWEVRYADEVMAGVAAEGMAAESALLFGRRTYEDFYGFWPNQPQPNPFTDVLNRVRKYVASRTLSPARTRSRPRSTPSTATRRARPARIGCGSCGCTTS